MLDRAASCRSIADPDRALCFHWCIAHLSATSRTSKSDGIQPAFCCRCCFSGFRVTMKTYAADRLRHLQESVIRSITRYAFDKGAILLAQGFPDFDPPQEVLAAAEKAMRNGKNQYGMTWGQPSLRAAIAEKNAVLRPGNGSRQECHGDMRSHRSRHCRPVRYRQSRRESRGSRAGPRKLSCGYRIRRRNSGLGSAASTSLSL